ncbi:hypothetical protein BKA01_001542 [Pseudonocardia eucalypti]|nr:hypothetical protein [Pseudonocardia eucalypti]
MAERFVAPLGRRWLHVQGVAWRAAELAPAVPVEQRAPLVAAAWLHDIGYSPRICHTGFHSLDAARYLRATGWPAVVVILVAHHSGARFEAAERGLAHTLLAEFPYQDSPLHDALATADLTTGPVGERLSYEEWISDILGRYAPKHPTHRAALRAGPALALAVHRTLQRSQVGHRPLPAAGGGGACQERRTASTTISGRDPVLAGLGATERDTRANEHAQDQGPDTTPPRDPQIIRASYVLSSRKLG